MNGLLEVDYFKRLRFFILLFSAALVGIGSGAANAEAIGDSGDDWRLKLNANFTAPGAHTQREDHVLYRIDFACKSKASPLPQKNVFNIVAMHSVTTSHSVVISKDYVPADTSGKLKLPEKPLRLLTPYAMNGSNVVDNRSICPSDPIVLSGTQPLYLVATVSYSTTNTPGAIIKIGYSIAKLIPALWSIFQPEVIPADIARKVSSVGDTKGPMEDILSTFNEDDSYGKGFNLDVGRYVVATDYNEITITVSKMESVALSKPTSLQENFRAQLKSAPEQIKPESIGTTCVTIAGALKEAGFSEKEDIPYALTYLSSRLGSKPKMVECLAEAKAIDTALQLGDILWKWIPRAVVLTKDYIDGLQPSSFSDAKARIYNFIVALSRITKGDPARAAEGLAQLKLVASEKIKIIDSVDDYLGGSAELAPADLAQRLINQKYFRFGCMAAVGDKNGLGLSEGIGSFLIIKAAADATSAPLSDALLVHVVFKGGLISGIVAFQEPSWAKTDLDANEGNCNGFKLTSPAIASRGGNRIAQQ
jgi:hypothetical protein